MESLHQHLAERSMCPLKGPQTFLQLSNTVHNCHLNFSQNTPCLLARGGKKNLKISHILTKKFLTFTKRQILDSSKLKEFADDNFKFDENGRKFLKPVENTVGKRRNCSFSHSVFKTQVMQTHKIQGLFGKGLTLYQTTQVYDWCKLKAFADKKIL